MKTEEPLAAILAEMRDKRIIRLDGADVTRCLLLNLADRIEAAVERRVKEAKDGVWQNADEIHDIHCRDCTARLPGNAAAMRRALESVEGNIAEDEPGRFWLQDPEAILHEVQAAIAAPARNCDRFANGTEAGIAFRAERHKVDEDAFWPNLVNWLFAPAEGGGHA